MLKIHAKVWGAAAAVLSISVAQAATIGFHDHTALNLESVAVEKVSVNYRRGPVYHNEFQISLAIPGLPKDSVGRVGYKLRFRADAVECNRVELTALLGTENISVFINEKASGFVLANAASRDFTKAFYEEYVANASDPQNPGAGITIRNTQGDRIKLSAYCAAAASKRSLQASIQEFSKKQGDINAALAKIADPGSREEAAQQVKKLSKDVESATASLGQAEAILQKFSPPAKSN